MIKSWYIRVDANDIIGLGHLVRTEILADELSRNNLTVNFICKTIPNEYIRKLESKNYNVFIINNTMTELVGITNQIVRNSNNLLIIDSDIDEFYTEAFQISIRKSGIKLMIITFHHQYHFYADIILNQNIMALSQEYSCENYTTKLLGPKNVILNNDYRLISKNLGRYKTCLKNKTVILTFGGVDQPDRTSFVYQSLQRLRHSPDKIIIVLGAMYKNRKFIEKIVNKSSIKTEIYQNTPKMPYLLAESAIVFNSGGLTVWEAGALKVLNVILGFSHREQTGGKFIGENKLGFYLGKKDDFTIESLSEKIDDIIKKENSERINNLSSKIDVNGISNIVKSIKKVL